MRGAENFVGSFALVVRATVGSDFAGGTAVLIAMQRAAVLQESPRRAAEGLVGRLTARVKQYPNYQQKSNRVGGYVPARFDFIDRLSIA